jgi:hypothetical protein
MSLSEAQVERYSRQIILPEIGGRGQERLLAAALFLATDAEPAADAARSLVAAGVGRIALPEGAHSLADELGEINPDLRIDGAASSARRAVPIGARSAHGGVVRNDGAASSARRGVPIGARSAHGGVVRNNGAATRFDIALGGPGAFAADTAPGESPPWISGGVRAARAWVAVGGAAAPVCAACRRGDGESGDIYRSPAHGVAAAHMALVAMKILIGLDSGGRRPLSVFDLATMRWGAVEGDVGCAPCAVAGARLD